MRIIRVLVVDDSAFMRKVLREMLETDPEIEVIGTAWNGHDALEQISELQPDVVTTDLFMPDMDGVELIRRQMVRRPLPIVVCSSADKSGEKVLAAMDAGAVEFIGKPTAMALKKMYNIQKDIIRAVEAAALVPEEKLNLLFNGHLESEAAPLAKIGPAALEGISTAGGAQRHAGAVEAVLIGVSTGGPKALRSILPRFPADMRVPIAIVLHMPPGYTKPLADRLNEISQLEVIESADGVEMKPGRAILAQAGLHTILKQLPGGQVVTALSPEPRDSLYVPAVDQLFQSGAQVYQGRVLAVVLTGMGNDGTQGAAWVKAAGGKVIVEAESSSVVFGMPRAVLEAGLADRVVPLSALPEAILEEIS